MRDCAYLPRESRPKYMFKTSNAIKFDSSKSAIATRLIVVEINTQNVKYVKILSAKNIKCGHT